MPDAIALNNAEFELVETLVATEHANWHGYGWVAPVMAAWLPNILFLGLGLLGLRRLE